jgi:hypothetical protein
MRNLKIIILCFGIFTIFSCSTSKKSDWISQALKGKVKSYTETFYNVAKSDNSWKPAGEPMNETLNSFDENGFLLEYIFQRKKDSLYQKTKFTRDVQKKVTGASVFNRMDKKIGAITYNWKNITEFTWERTGTNGNKVISGSSKLNDDGALIEEIMSSANGVKITSTVTYNKDGRITEQKQMANDKTTSISSFNYLEDDQHGNWVKRFVYSGEKRDVPIGIAVRLYTYY